MGFKETHSREDRRTIAANILQRFPDRVPIICEPASDKCRIDKVKFLAPRDFKMGHFAFSVRQRIPHLSSKEAIYIFVGADATIPSNSAPIEEIYQRFKDEDGLLYMKFDKEKTFG